MVAILEGRLPDILTIFILELSNHLHGGIIENPYGISVACPLE